MAKKSASEEGLPPELFGRGWDESYTKELQDRNTYTWKRGPVEVQIEPAEDNGTEDWRVTILLHTKHTDTLGPVVLGVQWRRYLKGCVKFAETQLLKIARAVVP